MKKIKELLIPIIALFSAIPIVAPLFCLTSCGQKSASTREVEIIDPTSSVAFTKTMLADGSIEINLCCSSEAKKINSVQVKIGTTEMSVEQYTFVNNKITIAKTVLDVYAGKIFIIPELKEVTNITLNVTTNEIEPNESFDIKANLIYEKANLVITWTVDKENVVTLDKTTSRDGEAVKVTATMGGSVTLTATCNGHSATCAITVTTKSITLKPLQDGFEAAIIELTSYDSKVITNAVDGTNKASWPLKDITTTVQRFKIELENRESKFIKTIEVPKGAISFEVELTSKEWSDVLDESINELEPEYIWKKAYADVTPTDLTTYFNVDASQTSTKLDEPNPGYSTTLQVKVIAKQALVGKLYYVIKSDATKKHYEPTNVNMVKSQEFTLGFPVYDTYWSNINYDDTLEVHFELS